MKWTLFIPHLCGIWAAVVLCPRHLIRRWTRWRSLGIFMVDWGLRWLKDPISQSFSLQLNFGYDWFNKLSHDNLVIVDSKKYYYDKFWSHGGIKKILSSKMTGDYPIGHPKEQNLHEIFQGIHSTIRPGGWATRWPGFRPCQWPPHRGAIGAV